MRRATCWYLIRSDTYRVDGGVSVRAVLKAARQQPSLRMLIIFRWGAWARSTPGHRIARAITSILHNRYSTLYAIEIPFATQVGPGLRINHRVGGVVVNGACRLGRSVTLNPGVVLGSAESSTLGEGTPTLGDHVLMAAGATALGPITMGAGSVAAARALVTRDVPPGCVVAGVPARVLEGTEPLLAKRLDFETLLGPAPSDAFSLADPQ